MFLLDVNVLIALVDENHDHHELVTDWFIANQQDGWATCPIVENGFVRIVGHPNYPDGPQSTEAARALLAKLCQAPGHQFWPDSLSIREKQKSGTLPASKHLTDHYLLMLAVANKSQLATLDQRIAPQAIPGGEAALCVIR
jgi:toxin-antitoxin system PIN domain toxin